MSTTDKLAGAIIKKPAASVAAKRMTSKNPIINMLLNPKFKRQMAMALPKSLTADRLTRVVMTEFRKTPALMNCDQHSVLGAILQCAALGLEPGSALGHCYLLPFGNGKSSDVRPNCQLIIGYRGMIDLARRSGQIVSLSAYCVHEGDDFHYELGLHPDIHHIPGTSADNGIVTFVYAVAVLKGGGVQFEVMSRAEIENVRKTSKAGKSGPWASHWEEMAKKTVIRRLFKYLPVSIEATRAVEVDEKADRGEGLTEQDWLDAEYVDKGTEEAAPVIEDVPDEVAEAKAPEQSQQSMPPAPPAEEDPWLTEMKAAEAAQAAGD